MTQERTIVLTANGVYNVDKKKIKRNIPYVSMQAVSKTIAPSENIKDIVMHIPREYDYLVSLERRDEMLTVLKKAYFENRKQNLPIFGFATDDLKSVTNTESDLKKKQYEMPDPATRMMSEDYDKRRSSVMNS